MLLNVIALTVALSKFALPFAELAPGQLPSALKIHRQWSPGHVFHGPKTLVMRTPEQLQQLGMQCPDEVDFSRQTVILVSAGARRSTGYAVRVREVVRDADGVTIRAKLTVPAAGALVGWAITYPQVAVIVDRIPSGVPVTVEPLPIHGRVGSLPGGPPMIHLVPDLHRPETPTRPGPQPYRNR